MLSESSELTTLTSSAALLYQPKARSPPWVNSVSTARLWHATARAETVLPTSTSLGAGTSEFVSPFMTLSLRTS
eukprot:CAMPEP_0197570364 /NCGR_PEP_ID=MMETSP1320-20131121/40572_1 /TAXON_ID=91990 /ORGANISM="Bolidomonas sp., Strain RCC2347" /LENGTH=73 /DNA_ID=CAMNT_0043132791 /DNA_START=41 /DNA_END=258 /DNA_ORIENTATION=+